MTTDAPAASPGAEATVPAGRGRASAAARQARLRRRRVGQLRRLDALLRPLPVLPHGRGGHRRRHGRSHHDGGHALERRLPAARGRLVGPGALLEGPAPAVPHRRGAALRRRRLAAVHRLGPRDGRDRRLHGRGRPLLLHLPDALLRALRRARRGADVQLRRAHEPQHVPHALRPGRRPRRRGGAAGAERRAGRPARQRARRLVGGRGDHGRPLHARHPLDVACDARPRAPPGGGRRAPARRLRHPAQPLVPLPPRGLRAGLGAAQRHRRRLRLLRRVSDGLLGGLRQSRHADLVPRRGRVAAAGGLDEQALRQARHLHRLHPHVGGDPVPVPAPGSARTSSCSGSRSS